MALHVTSPLDDEIYADTYAEPMTTKAIPKFKMADESTDPESVYSVIMDELLFDGNAKLNLSTFCQTSVDPIVHKLMDNCIGKNMMDKDEYPQTAEIERRCVHIIADLWNSPDSANTMGCSTTGSSEAAMLGGLAMKWRWREKRKKEGKPTDKPNIVTGPVQVCWQRFARYFDVEIREIPMEHDRMLMTPEVMLQHVDENTIGVVPTLGITFTLQYEDVKGISDALDKLQKDTGLDIPIHVDGASGGFLAPFIQKDLVWDFRLPRVKSINSSGHKFGLSPLGCGWVIWRDAEDLPKDLIFEVNYLGGNMATFALNFSRSAGPIVSQYFNLLRYGRDGYTSIQKACQDHGIYIAQEIEKIGLFDIIYDGKVGVPGAAWKLKKDANVGFDLYDLADRMRGIGWQVAAYSLPTNCEDIVVQRMLIRHGFSHDLAEKLINDTKLCIEYFKQHPVAKVAKDPAAQPNSFHH